MRGNLITYRHQGIGIGIVTRFAMEESVGISLTKGGNVNLTKQAPGLTAVTVGLGWDARTTTGTDFDLDASAIALRGLTARSSRTSTSCSSTT